MGRDAGSRCRTERCGSAPHGQNGYVGSLIDDVRGDVATVNTKATEAHDLSITLQSSGATVVARLDAYRDEVLALRNTADRINERIRAIADRETMAEVRVRITALEEMLFPRRKGH